MSDEEFQIYSELLQNMLEHVHVPKLMVYLEISVDTIPTQVSALGSICPTVNSIMPIRFISGKWFLAVESATAE
ncbi:deoxynucleoside kinase, partial [Erysipelothrix rhusiopathiae]|nr:deoxynucleoside kinase [Erysipelothrix rhusiopathiae]